MFVLEAVALIFLARLMFDVPFPERRSRWRCAVAGALSFAALGVALTTFIRSAEGASAVISAVYLPMAFLAGSFWTTQAYPPVLEAIANVLPLTYFIELMRDRAPGRADLGQLDGRRRDRSLGHRRARADGLRFRWEPQQG